MSYGSPSPAPVRRKGGGLIFFVVIALAAFVMLSNRNPTPQDGAPRPDRDGQGHSAEKVLGTEDYADEQLRKDVLGGGGDFDGKPMPTAKGEQNSGDWSIKDVDDQENREPSQATSGDWSLDTDVKSKKDSKRNQFKFSNENESSPPSTDSGGDWSIKDASDPKKSGSKTTDDWSIKDAAE